MDLFNLLSKGANINRKQKDELKQLSGQRNVTETPEIENRINFFTPARRHAPAPVVNTENNVPEIDNETDALKFRKSHKIKSSGDSPIPISNFSDLEKRYNVSERLLRNVAKLGFDKPTPVQSEAVPALLEQRDLLACAPTGSGKTLAFVLPIIQKLVDLKNDNDSENVLSALIVSPTRELANQIYEVAIQLSRGQGLSIALLNKTMLAKLRNNNAGSKQKMNLIISTPQRLLDGARQKLFSLNAIKYLVLDECDKLLGDSGFVSQTDEIVGLCTNSSVVKAVFSATLPTNVEELARSVMTAHPCRLIVGHKDGAATDIEQKLVYCGSESGKLTAIRQMLAGGKVKPPIIVFVQSVQRAKALFHELLYDKVNVDVIHSELSQNQRERVVNQFKQGDIWVLVCTDVLSRGIDFQGVNLVINYDVPGSAQAYVHRIGRTGRAGRAGSAVTFYTNQDVESLAPVVNVMRQSGVEISDWLLAATRKKRGNKPLVRDAISTVPKVVKRKQRQRREMIDASKRRHAV